MALITDDTIVPLPAPFTSIPRVPLQFPYPSPIEHLSRLETRLNSDTGSGKISLFIKRDDCNSGLGGGGGGNKIRKLEYVLADAVAQSADTLVTIGGVQSNHMRQTAAAGAKLGMETVLLPQNAVPNTTSAYTQLGNVQLTHLMSAMHQPIDTKKEKVLSDLEKQGKKPYFIPAGASLHELGGLGYARCAFEIIQQEKALFEEQDRFDVILVPTMSGSTLGGLVAGFKAIEQSQSSAPTEQRKRRLIGISAGPIDIQEFKTSILGIAQTAAKHIGLDPESITKSDFEVDDRWSAGQYGRLDEKTNDSIKLLASIEGVITDPVYSGKALTGMMQMIRDGEVEAGSRVLFLHTGGVMSVSAYEKLR